MELITILKRCHRFRGFVCQHAYFSADKKSIDVAVRPRKGSAAVCPLSGMPVYHPRSRWQPSLTSVGRRMALFPS